MIAVAGKTDQLHVSAKTRSALAAASRSAGHFDIGKIRTLGWAPRINLGAGLSRMLRSQRQVNDV